MSKTLQKIANLLILNIQNIESVGLLNGKMGVVIFLYHYARHASQTVYSDQADDLLDELFAVLNTGSVPPLLETDVAGIGFGLNHLIANRFIETEEGPDELFKDVDICLLQDIDKQLLTNMWGSFPIFSLGLYALSRIESGRRTPQKNKLVFSLLEGINVIYANNKIVSNPIYTNFVIRFLTVAYDLGIYKANVKKTLKKVLSLVSNTFSETKYRFSDIEILQNILLSTKLYPKLVNEILLRTNQLNLYPTNNEDINTIVMDLQQYMFYLDLDYSRLSKFSIEEYLNKQIVDSSFQDLFPLPYIGLHLMGVKLC